MYGSLNGYCVTKKFRSESQDDREPTLGRGSIRLDSWRDNISHDWPIGEALALHASSEWFDSTIVYLPLVLCSKEVRYVIL